MEGDRYADFAGRYDLFSGRFEASLVTVAAR